MPVPSGNSYLNTELSTNGAQNVDSVDVQRDSIGYPKCADFSSPIARRGLRRFRKVFPTTPEPRECRRLPHRTTHPIPGMGSVHRTAPRYLNTAPCDASLNPKTTASQTTGQHRNQHSMHSYDRAFGCVHHSSLHWVSGAALPRRISGLFVPSGSDCYPHHCAEIENTTRRRRPRPKPSRSPNFRRSR